jgi:hypothetical protein
MELDKYIKKKEMRTVQVELTCPECEKGNLFANAQQPVGATEQGEPIFLHNCTNQECGHQLQITKPYPHITHEPKEESTVLKIHKDEEE